MRHHQLFVSIRNVIFFMSLSNVCLAYFIQVIPQIMQHYGFRKFSLFPSTCLHRMNVLVTSASCTEFTSCCEICMDKFNLNRVVFIPQTDFVTTLASGRVWAVPESSNWPPPRTAEKAWCVTRAACSSSSRPSSLRTTWPFS
jgi:hypothetical protein